MIHGIGTDIVNITRIFNLYKKYQNKFVNKILSKQEIIIFDKLSNFNNLNKKIYYLANRWAAKEAVVKALGTGFRNGLYWPEISIVNNSLGKPEVELSIKAEEIFNNILDNKPSNIHLSISDDSDYVVCYVILELI